MMSQSEDLKHRTKQFALRIIRLFQGLPGTAEARIPGQQLLRSGTSVAANYRAVCRSRSKAEFVAKIGLVVEEADETVLWLELLTEGGVIEKQRVGSLMQEAKELLAIFAASHLTSRRALPKTKKVRQSEIGVAVPTNQ
jgi:four helix bundle protein